MRRSQVIFYYMAVKNKYKMYLTSEPPNFSLSNLRKNQSLSEIEKNLLDYTYYYIYICISDSLSSLPFYLPQEHEKLDFFLSDWIFF